MGSTSLDPKVARNRPEQIAQQQAANATVEFRVAKDRPRKPVIALTISGYYATDAVLDRLKAFPELEELALTGNQGGMSPGPNWQVTDAGVAHLKTLKHFHSLSIPTSKMTDIGLVHLGEMTQLRELVIGKESIGRTENITDEGIKHLNKLHDLRSLELLGTSVTDNGLASLKELSQLRSLRLRFAQGGITERSLSHLGQFENLELLDIGDWISPAQPFDEDLAHLKRVPHLQSLTIFSMRVTDVGLSHLSEMSQLRSLELYHALASMPITDSGLRHLRELTELRSLTLGISNVTDKGLEAIASLKHLEFLELTPFTRAEITDDGLLQLCALPASKS